MIDEQSKIDDVESGFAPLSGIAFEKAQAKLFASGTANICASGGMVYEISADGKKKPIKQIAPPISVGPDTPIRIQ